MPVSHREWSSADGYLAPASAPSPPLTRRCIRRPTDRPGSACSEAFTQKLSDPD
jgi:hypothetical protein